MEPKVFKPASGISPVRCVHLSKTLTSLIRPDEGDQVGDLPVRQNTTPGWHLRRPPEGGASSFNYPFNVCVERAFISAASACFAGGVVN